MSQAKIGDKFINNKGDVLEFVKFHIGYSYPYELKNKLGYIYLFANDGSFIKGEENPLDLVKQVFDDKKDTTDLEIVEVMNQAIKEIPEKAAERERELQRMQEVVELAEKMYTMLEIENFKYYLCNNGNNAFESEELIRLTFVRADAFINKKHQYLKEGKLC